MALNNSTWHDTDSTLFRQILVLLEIRLPLVAQIEETGIFRKPVGEVVFWQDSEFGTLSGGRSNKICCLVEVVLEVKWLRGSISMWS